MFEFTLLMIALNAAVLFAGAALVISVAEHPARLLLDDANALKQFVPSYKHAAVMQVSLAAVSVVCGLHCWWTSGSIYSLLGAIAIGTNIPFTVIVIMPINKQLIALHDANKLRPDIRSMLNRWGELHAVRTALALGASFLYTCAVSNSNML